MSLTTSIGCVSIWPAVVGYPQNRVILLPTSKLQPHQDGHFQFAPYPIHLDLQRFGISMIPAHCPLIVDKNIRGFFATLSVINN